MGKHIGIEEIESLAWVIYATAEEVHCASAVHIAEEYLAKQKQDKRIRVRYADLPFNTARVVDKGSIIWIVLPVRHQMVIRNGKENNYKIWSADMLDAKNSLRMLTLHELGHILLDSYIESSENIYTRKSEEDDANCFATLLASMKKERNKGMYGRI